MMRNAVSLLFLIASPFFLLSNSPVCGFVPIVSPDTSRIASIKPISSSSTLFYRNEGSVDIPQSSTTTKITEKAPPVPIKKTFLNVKNKKPTIYQIHSLNELQSFIEDDDDRLIVVKFFAPWCKSCRRLGMHFERLAKEMGDGVLQRKKVEGAVRFVEIEYSSTTSELITETLQVRAVPTMQIYSGLNKLWEVSGETTTSKLRRELNNLEEKRLQESADEFQTYASTMDDGILQEAIEESFFDVQPDYW